MITIIHPSRNRAEKAFSTYKNWIGNCVTDLVRYFVSIEPDQEEEYSKYFAKQNIIIGNNSTAIEAINNAAAKVEFDILIVVSDDFSSFKGWDKIILREVGHKSNYVLKTYDGLQKWIVTLPIMDREFYDSQNYVYYPGYKHLFCDTELTTVAEYTGRLIIRNDIVFPHKPLNDQQHNNTDSTWNQGEQLYLERYKNNFWVSKTYEISDFNHRKWITQRT